MNRLKNYLFKNDARAEKSEEKLFMRKSWVILQDALNLTDFIV